MDCRREEWIWHDVRTALGARQVPANWNASGNSLEMQVASKKKKKIPLQINHQKIERVKCFFSHGKKSILVPWRSLPKPVPSCSTGMFGSATPKAQPLGTAGSRLLRTSCLCLLYWNNFQMRPYKQARGLFHSIST